MSGFRMLPYLPLLLLSTTVNGWNMYTEEEREELDGIPELRGTVVRDGERSREQQAAYGFEPLRLPCYSCMSPYLSEHFPYLQNLYNKPRSFVEECNEARLDKTYLLEKNCSDMCVTLRMTDVIGGRSRYGYMRGCINDILGFNHTVARVIEERYEASGRRRPGCVKVMSRHLFVATGGRQPLQDSNSDMELCGCFTPGCNSSHLLASSTSLLTILIFLLIYRQ